MQTSEKLLKVIEALDRITAELRVDSKTVFADRAASSVEELYWLYRDLSEYE